MALPERGGSSKDTGFTLLRMRHKVEFDVLCICIQNRGDDLREYGQSKFKTSFEAHMSLQ